MEHRLEPGRAAYEADLRKQPNYPDGSPRKTWDQLPDLARWSWSRVKDSLPTGNTNT